MRRAWWRRGPPGGAPPRGPTPPPEPERVSMPLPLLEPLPELEPARSRAADDDGAGDTGALSQAEPVLTETMAELYLNQGHKTDALRVYQWLLGQPPADLQLPARIAQLAGQALPAAAAPAPPPRRRSGPGSGETVGSFLKGVLGGRRVTPPPAPAPPRAASTTASAASAAAESTLDSAFSGSADAEGSSQQVGKPSRPAEDSISLDSVFGEESGRGSGPQATAARPASASGGAGGFSFDDFFGGAAPGRPPAAGPPRPPRAAATPGAAAEAKGAAPRASRPRGRAAGGGEGWVDRLQCGLQSGEGSCAWPPLTAP